MAFIVEDGTGLSDANSYASVQEYRDYAELRNIDVTLELDATIQGYLINATDYVELTYEYIGEALTDTQMLSFPRLVNDEDIGLPTKVINATIELALEGSNGSDLFAVDDEKNITSLTEKVGSIETSTKYDTTLSIYRTPSQIYPKPYKLLKPYIENINNSGQIPTIN